MPFLKLASLQKTPENQLNAVKDAGKVPEPAVFLPDKGAKSRPSQYKNDPLTHAPGSPWRTKIIISMPSRAKSACPHAVWLHPICHQNGAKTAAQCGHPLPVQPLVCDVLHLINIFLCSRAAIIIAVNNLNGAPKLNLFYEDWTMVVEDKAPARLHIGLDTRRTSLISSAQLWCALLLSSHSPLRESLAINLHLESWNQLE